MVWLKWIFLSTSMHPILGLSPTKAGGCLRDTTAMRFSYLEMPCLKLFCFFLVAGLSKVVITGMKPYLAFRDWALFVVVLLFVTAGIPPFLGQTK